MKEFFFNTISEFHQFNDFPPPENPLFSVKISEENKADLSDCENNKLDEPTSISTGFYSISLKNVISGDIVYGKTKYDCSSGSLLCTGPNQTLIFTELVFSSEWYHISFHKDYLVGTPLYDKIKKFNFFNYYANEALHLSPKEEEFLKPIFTNIESEYYNTQDEFSKDIILSQLETLLKYIDRFYKRQFLDRQQLNKDLYSRFRETLDKYFEANLLSEKGIPTVDWLAQQLNVSHRYMSDMIKTETGRTAIDQINSYLIDQAKNLLLNPKLSISETAYQLGFEYPQYFSRLFKKKVGLSPKQYIESQQLN